MLLVLAVIAMLAPRALSSGTAGRASAAEPPRVGDCLTAAALSVVPCTDPHAWEVSARWLADDPAAAGTGKYCRRQAGDLVSAVPAPVVGTWSIPTNFESSLLAAPAGAGGWLICALRPATHENYVGSFIGVADIADRPHVFGTCYDASLSGPPTSCQRPHASELLATLSGEFTDFILPSDTSGDTTGDHLVPGVTAAMLAAECDQLAAVLTDSADPTRGGQLEIAFSEAVVSSDSKYPTTRQFQASCAMRSSPNRLLADSVVGLGDAAVPFE